MAANALVGRERAAAMNGGEDGSTFGSSAPREHRFHPGPTGTRRAYVGFAAKTAPQPVEASAPRAGEGA
jgi:hypothetical protein